MLLVGFILIGLSLGNVLSMALTLLLGHLSGDFTFDQIGQILANPESIKHSWWYLMLIQVITHLFTFLVPCLIYWRVAEKRSLIAIFSRPRPLFSTLLIVAFLVIAFMPFNSWVIDWNNSMTFPAGLHKVESWMQQKESELSVLTIFLTNFDTSFQLFIAVCVIAIIPAIGEEVLFRGIIQRKIFSKTLNSHLSIWIAALLFSAIHLQFYGFIPRVLLGALFGYLYVWSANILIPITAHFVNNAITIFLYFAIHRKMTTYRIEDLSKPAPSYEIIFSLVISAFLLYLIKRRYENPTRPT